MPKPNLYRFSIPNLPPRVWARFKELAARESMPSRQIVVLGTLAATWCLLHEPNVYAQLCEEAKELAPGKPGRPRKSPPIEVLPE
mgnify:CR=1 FL=1